MKVAVVAMVLGALQATALAAPTAEELYAQGHTDLLKKEYASAIKKWKQSYQLSNEPLMLFNIARAYRLAGDCGRALATYQEFVASDPEPQLRGLADGQIAELEPECGPRAPVRNVDRIDQPVEHPRSGGSLKIAGLVTGGAGFVLIVTGIYFGHRASTLGDEVANACSPSCDWPAVQDKDAEGHRDAALGWTCDALGAAALAGGAVLYYLGDREHRLHVAPLAARPYENGAVLSWGGSW